MGYLREAYTKEYFLCRDATGKRVDYGALGAEEWLAGGISDEIRGFLESVPFSLRAKRVLEIGFGRGESADYLLREKQIACYTGIDFSDAAYELALDRLTGAGCDSYDLILGDALEVLRARRFQGEFDVVYMLDVIEHIPNHEIDELLNLLHGALRPLACIIVHTPFYGVDEDFFAQDGIYLDPSPTDLHPKTRGMHCNKFSRLRLLSLMNHCGYTILNDRVFFKRLPLLHDLRNRFFFWRARRQRSL
jgi:2-polyprenyl-3-methyl-5-hydroxy-6-metoxy-1,4-benzoquinol methylase